MADQIKVVIDGKKCTCDYGEYLYDVATRNGIFIPVLCRHEGFEDHRACCRICIVEVEINGRSKVVTSCVYPLERDCIVRTNSKKIKEERAVVMALLSHRAPDAQPITQMANFMGGGDDQGFAKLVSLDKSKCILCGLCVQACDSLGTGAISTVNRGTDKEVNTPYGNPSLSCIGCLSCANVCPTDAIEFKETVKTRTIWNRKFDLVKCTKCGEVIGTKEQIEHSRKDVDVINADLCDACRKTCTAEVMRKSYGNN